MADGGIESVVTRREAMNKRARRVDNKIVHELDGETICERDNDAQGRARDIVRIGDIQVDRLQRGGGVWTMTRDRQKRGVV